MTKSKKTQKIDLNFDNIEKLEHLKPVPKLRSSSITSIESEDGSIKEVLKAPPKKEFEDIMAFESYIRDETWDNDFGQDQAYHEQKFTEVPQKPPASHQAPLDGGYGEMFGFPDGFWERLD